VLRKFKLQSKYIEAIISVILYYLILFPCVVKDNPCWPDVDIITFSKIGSFDVGLIRHSKMKLAPVPPSLSFSSMTISTVSSGAR
jgi:hypothetical protein